MLATENQLLSENDYCLLLLGEEVEIYIQYEGRLPSQNCKDKENRRIETHRVRRHLHSQLLRLWEKRFAPLACGLPPRTDASWKEQRQKYLKENSKSVSEFDFFPIV